jgi:hypothetical protein
MNLFETLKQFKNITPDSNFSATSKRAILATQPATPLWTARRTILRLLETGVAVALTGFFVLLVTGAFSGSKLEPVQYSAIDPQSLHAEADAIDMQIQLANLNYSEASAESTVSAPGNTKNPAKIAPLITVSPLSTSTGSTAPSVGTSTATTTLSIDQALQGLSN